jgi:hypothetical protein
MAQPEKSGASNRKKNNTRFIPVQWVSVKHRLVTANALALLRKPVLWAKDCVQTVTIASFPDAH